MPATKEQLERLVDTFEENINTKPNWNDWFWDFCSNPDTYVHFEDTGIVCLGRQEVTAYFNERAKVPPYKIKIQRPFQIHLNSFGQGVHLANHTFELIREKPWLPGMPAVTRHQSINFCDDNGKLIRMITSPADDESKRAIEILSKSREAARGVPEQGYPELKERYLEIEKNLASFEDSMAFMDDDAVFIDPTGNVFKGRAQIAPAIKGYYDLGFKTWTHVGEIRTPFKDTVVLSVDHDFSGLPDGVVPVKNPHVPQPVVYKFDLTSSKVKRLAILINNFQGVEYNMALASFTGKMMQEAAAKQKQQQIQSQEAA